MSTGVNRRRIAVRGRSLNCPSVVDSLEATSAGGDSAHSTERPGCWVAAGALKQADVEDELYAGRGAQELLWATTAIRSGLSAGLQQPANLDTDSR
jgi:hypothetical protein